MKIAIPIAALCLALMACGGTHRPARDRYNEGVAALEKKDFEAAQKAFTEAMGQAGVDPELRFRAAYDLGLAYAGQAAAAAAAQPPDPDKALSLYQQAAAWFQDANRQHEDDAARANLAIVLARAQALADEVNKGQNGLEPRLNRVIDEQRGIRDGARGLWAVVAAAAAGADPLAQRSAYEALATQERSLLAEAGVISDMADAEIAPIGAKPEEERTDEEKVRILQLRNLELYLQEARTAMSDARRQLQGLQGDAAHRRSEVALEQLKRAREQLLDPVKVLGSIGQDEMELLQHTGALSMIETRTTLEPAAAAQLPETAPAWLTGETLGERQAALKDRVSEVAMRLRAGVEGADKAAAAAAAGAAAGSGAAAPPQDPEQQKVIAQVRAALPLVDEAVAAMGRAREALSAGSLAPALAAEKESAVAIGRAIEQFSALRQVIDLAYGQQRSLVELLSPEGAKNMAADERARAVTDGIAANLERLARMAGLIAEEKAAAEAKLQAAQQQGPDPSAPPGPPGQPPADPQQPDQQLAALRAQYAQAETLRGQALAQVVALRTALAARGKDPLPPAKDAKQKIEELRKLFFSVIEHLQQLVHDQGETRDQTASAQALDDAGRGPLLPGLLSREAGHVDLGQAIAQALAEQADAAAQAPQGQAQPGAPTPQNLAEAAKEVTSGVGEMQDAAQSLTQARDQAQHASYDLQPVLDTQAKALAHLENALRLLQPPPPPKQDQQDQKQDPQQQEQQQQAKPEEKKQDDQNPADGLQKVRDDEARRLREQQERQRPPSDPVDKDW